MIERCHNHHQSEDRTNPIVDVMMKMMVDIPV